MAPARPCDTVWFSSNGAHSTSGCVSSRNTSSLFSKAQSQRLTISRFSCDIAYSTSPLNESRSCPLDAPRASLAVELPGPNGGGHVGRFLSIHGAVLELDHRE